MDRGRYPIKRVRDRIVLVRVRQGRLNDDPGPERHLMREWAAGKDERDGRMDTRERGRGRLLKLNVIHAKTGCPWGGGFAIHYVPPQKPETDGAKVCEPEAALFTSTINSCCVTIITLVVVSGCAVDTEQ